MALTTAGRNAAAGGVAASAGYASLHIADPGTTGAAELVGGAPAYARKAVAWGAAAGGQVAITGTATFDVPAGTTVAYVGLWDAATGGNFLGSGPLAAAESYTGQGTYGLNTLTVSVA